MDSLHFIRPLWLLALPLAFLLPWLWRRLRRPAGDWARVCDPHLLRWLSVKQHSEKGWSAGPGAAALGLAIAIVALAGPSWNRLPDSSFTARDARVIALDLSRSMQAQDLRPDRLTRARYRMADLLASTQEGQVGLISYAGDAYVVSPLTNDMNTIANLLPALRPDIMPVAGSRADLALDLAAALFERSGIARGEILLVTDSATARDAARARDLRDRGIITSVLAVGTTKGAPIPSGGGFVSDRSGNVVIARLARPKLRAVAEAGGGNYTELGTASSSASLWQVQDGSEFTRRDEALGERWQDAGPWLVLLLIPFVLAGFRRGVIFLLPLLIAPALLLPQAAEASWWEDVWLTRDQQAWRALQAQEPDRAAALANDPEIAGEAWFRSGDHANALESWSGLASAEAHYNRGNALAHLGQYDAALGAYDRALSLEPGMPDALHNRALVEQMKQQQEQQRREQQDQGESGESEPEPEGQEGEPSQSEGDEDAAADDASEPEEQSQQASESEGEEAQAQPEVSELAEAWSEEDAQAMEQWLRRIPDDPGGLLRRKFRNQHQRRGAPEDEAESW
jgi:Ca-activated chloride channel family protein